MNEIKTRTKTREIKVRDATALAPKELSKLMKDNAAVRQLRHWDSGEDSGTADSAAVRDAIGEFEGDAKGTAAYGSRKAYRAGKRLAQKEYDKQFRTDKSTAAKEADHSTVDGQPSDFSGQDTSQTDKAKRVYRKEKAKQQRENQREIKVRGEVSESRQTAGDLRQGNAYPDDSVNVSERRFAFGRDSGKKTATVPKKKMPLLADDNFRAANSGATTTAERAKVHATRKMQRQLAQETAQKSAQTTKTASKGLSQLKDAVVRTGKAIVRAAVGLLGGAGGLIALVLVLGGAAAVIGTPFGVFWSGQDADAQSVPKAVATINMEFTAKINQIQAEHPADSVVIHRVPGGSGLSITNWTDIVAVFAVKTAGADADATDVVTIDDERIDLLRKIFWDMNVVTYSVETVGDGEDTETILHITVTSKTAQEMPDIYHFNKNQRQALDEMLKPEYAQMLAELVGTYGGELTLTDEQIRQMLSQKVRHDRDFISF